ncbi:MAG: glycosyltransferase family 39 protein, partial [Chloroflexota bacterium]|nr:glycosyltransferase family 39 protein [Chloroflexota bacterium]
MTQRMRTPLLLLILFLAAWMPRVLALDRFVTYDERKWLARSANFYQAISGGDWANTFQREHPGVTVMWAGMLGFVQKFPTYAQQAPGQFTWEREHLEAWLHEQGMVTPLALLAAGRWWIVFAIALAITAGYFPLRRLFGVPLALSATLLIAWDPFFVALSRQLHPDGLVSSLIFLALLFFLAWLYAGQKRLYLIASAIVMGLAWLTKVPAIFLAPTGALLIALELLRARQAKDETPNGKRLIFGYVAWGAIATLTFVALWPAMWIDPLNTLGRMTAEMSDYTEGHVNTNYFLGQITTDPGLFFYPIAYLFRTTPAVLLGLVAGAIAAWQRAWPLDEVRMRRIAAALLIFALLFMAGMTLGAKKFDRYILPTFLALDVLAVLGLASLTQRIRSRLIGSSPHPLSLSQGLLVSLFLFHALPGLLHYPYYLTYFNPLTGGSRTAPNVLFVGWGEGLDAAADWLNRQPGAEQLRVVAWYADGPLSYFFQGQATGLGNNSPLLWLDADYAVLYANQWQRQIPDAATVDYFAAQTPAQIIRFRGLELARIYDRRNMPLPDFIDIGKASAADFGAKIRLAAYQFDQLHVDPGDRLQATFYLQSLALMTTNYNVLVRLVGQDGTELWREEGWPWGAPTTDWPLREVRPDGHT